LPPRRKMMMAVVAFAMPVVVVPFLPGETTARLQSIFSASSAGAEDAHQAELNSNAVDSTNARLQLQRRAVELTEEHLLLGIGPQNFQDAVDEMVKAHGGSKSGWQVAHNSYLAVSAESGIPGVLFYIWNIALCFKLNYQAFRRFRAEKGAEVPFLVTFSIFMATCTYAFGIFFCTIPYDFQLAMLVGLTASVHLSFKARIESLVIAQPANGRM
jgi:O-antigen ligase